MFSNHISFQITYNVLAILQSHSEGNKVIDFILENQMVDRPTKSKMLQILCDKAFKNEL